MYHDERSFYLAVDFFYILSGFVIAYAYGNRLDEGLSWKGFMRLRLLRLYPMLFAGVLVAGAVFLGRQIMSHTGLVTDTVVLTILSLSLLPAGLLYGMTSYPIDNPIWSLFFELVANGVYATRIRRLGRLWLIGLVVLAIGALAFLAVRFGTVGSLGFIGPGSFLAGFARVAVPFAFGAAIWRTQIFTKFPTLSFPLVALGLAVAMFLHPGARWAYDLLGVLIIFPLLVCLGARAHVGDFALRLCHVAKRGSYPLYILHMSVLRVVDMGYKMSHLRIGPLLPMVLAIVLSLAVSWAFLRLYDEPVRDWLTGRRRSKRMLEARVSVT